MAEKPVMSCKLSSEHHYWSYRETYMGDASHRWRELFAFPSRKEQGVKKLLIFILFLLVMGGSILAIIGDQNNIKTVHNMSTDSYVRKVNELKNGDKRDLLRAHSQEVQKVSDYTLPDKHTPEEAVNHFMSEGWEANAVLDALTWSLSKAYAILATSKGATEAEILKIIKEERPAWNDNYMQVLVEEIINDHE